MINPLLRLTALAWVWKKYRHYIIATLVLFAGFWLIGVIHDDFLEYATLKDQQNIIGLSFVLKWLGFLAWTLGYFAWLKKQSQSKKTKTKSNPLSSRIPKPSEAKTQSDPSPASDPFSNLRDKTKLRSKAEIILQSPSKK